MLSAIAQVNVFPGAAVAQSKDTVTLASTGLLATHIAAIGAVHRGIVNMQADGKLTLNDWSLATGRRTLATGATYYAGASGRLVTTGGQPVGIATSPVTLSVTIQNSSQSTSTSADLTAIQAQITVLQEAVLQLSKSVAGGAGVVGTGSPEGAVSASPGTAYLDGTGDHFWMKKTGTGNTGWVELIA